ncbi:MAG: biopolymer transporter ExbD [Planctomycetes bacterium]|nr:biopolymer transporter ExbD [Planctomycetota bacterium]
MSLGINNRFSKPPQSFNMTPIIDIVFLLMIFFMVVCQFIEAENFPVTVPDSCDFAETAPERKAGLTTVTVMKSIDGKIIFAVGAEKIPTSNPLDTIENLTRLINIRLNQLPPERRMVILRIDKDVCYADAQYALAALAESNATDIQLAAIKEKRINSQ